MNHLLQLLRAEATEKSWLTVTITQKTLKAKRYTLQSNPMHHSKKGSITTITSTKHSYLQEIVSFVARWYCTYNTSANTDIFF